MDHHAQEQFDALKILEESAFISNRGKTGLFGETNMNISFPQLMNATGLSISGKVSRWSRSACIKALLTAQPWQDFLP
jgi:hypothetical protein